MEIKKEGEKLGDGVAWYRGAMVGKGSFGCVYLATLKNPRLNYSYFRAVMAVKSAEVSVSGSIQKEREVLGSIGVNGKYRDTTFEEKTVLEKE
ncbi:hypothetical protein CQW23_31631 [Capsicum baccatum]|uniref:Protein kinase domain-containing protein n=1 Tax=Capsicum baccatum TaxID=33114 RepID=A0A2G2V711_CAPBA|nr:hypothetical protein CQW23_31631 [Capsicum baccatum]